MSNVCTTRILKVLHNKEARAQLHETNEKILYINIDHISLKLSHSRDSWSKSYSFLSVEFFHPIDSSWMNKLSHSRDSWSKIYSFLSVEISIQLIHPEWIKLSICRPITLSALTRPQHKTTNQLFSIVINPLHKPNYKQ
mgnify:CR=1 FL=1